MTSAQDIRDNGEQVFTHKWQRPDEDSVTETVYRLGDQYYAVTSFMDKPVGPYDSLWETVQAIGLEEVNRSAVALSCTEMGADEVAVRLRTTEGPGHTFTINGEPWAIGDGKLIVPVA